MRAALQHLVLLPLAVILAGIGWYVAHNPVRMFRFLTFGVQREQKFFVGFCRAAGWFWVLIGTLGALMYSILIVVDLLQ